jgi:hypothetical protein
MRQDAAAIVLMLLLPMAAACHQSALPAADSGRMVFVTGQGRLLSVDQVLGIGTLKVDGRGIQFSWKNEAVTPVI